jgi:pimeloyl-ACP methyl ester carboxylesterase
MSERQTIRLEDGSRIDLMEFGDPSGAAAIYLHGTPSSAREAQWMHTSAIAHGVRLVSFDRPGYHGSAPAAAPGLAAAARQVVGGLRMLGIERCAVIGFSGGAGIALSVAAEAPDAVTIVHLGGGMGPFVDGSKGVLPLSRRLPFALIARSPRIGRFILGQMSKRMRKMLGKKLGVPTLAALELLEGSSRGPQLGAAEAYARATPPEDLRAWVADYIAGSVSVDAVRADISTLAHPWPFELAHLETPVELWHGTADGAVPIAYAEALARTLPKAKLHVLEGEGHFVFLTHGDEVCASVRASS